MLKKLRIKFIALIMAIVSVILAATFSVICYSDWQKNINDANMALEAAISRAAHAQNTDTPKHPTDNASAENQYPPPHADGGPVYIADSEGNVAVENQSGIRGIYPATKSGRFDDKPIPNIFTAVHKLEGDEWVLLFENSTALAIGPEFSNSWAVNDMGLHEGTGMFGNRDLYYMEKTLPEGTFLAMMYAGPLYQWKDLAIRLAGLGAVTLIVFFFISLAFSKWALDPVKKAWVRQQRFVADASHDLKTPITVILANTGILLDRGTESIDSQRRWIESTKTEAEEMQKLIEDLLLLANEDEQNNTPPDSSKDSPPVASTNLSRLIGKDLLQFESVAFERGIQLNADIADNVTVAGTEQDIRRITQTLLDNAFKYADDGGTVSVSLCCDNPKRNALLNITNSGTAIPKDELPYIFDRFYRSDKARTANEGHGLGLAIADTLIKKYGGKISASSDEETGTAFEVRLKLK